MTRRIVWKPKDDLESRVATWLQSVISSYGGPEVRNLSRRILEDAGFVIDEPTTNIVDPKHWRDAVFSLVTVGAVVSFIRDQARTLQPGIAIDAEHKKKLAAIRKHWMGSTWATDASTVEWLIRVEAEQIERSKREEKALK